MRRVLKTIRLRHFCIIALVMIFSPILSQAESDRSKLPISQPAFSGKIGKSFENSVEDFPQPIQAPKDAPNIVLILLDDVGFGQPGTFGGPVPTPCIDSMASQGLRYNRFHTTAICSPTRAVLLTGPQSSPGRFWNHYGAFHRLSWI